MLYYITTDKLHLDKIQKFLGSVLFFLSFFRMKLILLFSKDPLNWSKVTVKTFTMLQKISILNK